MQKRLPPAWSLFGIVEGTIQLSVRPSDGVLLPFVPFGAGYWLGDVAMLSGEPGLVSIESKSDVTTVHIPAPNADLKIARRLMILTEFANLDGNWMKVSNNDIASQLGLSLPTVQRAMTRLAGIGFLEHRYSQIRGLDPEALAVVKA